MFSFDFLGAPHKRGSRLISYQSAAIAAELAATARQWAADVGASFGRWCINGSDSSDTSDDCERSQRKCNSSCGLLNEGRLGDVGVGVVGHWFEVLWRSSLLDLFTISVPAGNHLPHSRDLFSGFHPPSGTGRCGCHGSLDSRDCLECSLLFACSAAASNSGKGAGARLIGWRDQASLIGARSHFNRWLTKASVKSVL